MRPRLLRAFLVGTGATGLAAYTGAAAIGLALAAAGDEARTAVVGLVVLEIDRGATGTVTTFGPGLAVVGLAGGALNAVVAMLLARRRSRGAAATLSGRTSSRRSRTP